MLCMLSLVLMLRASVSASVVGYACESGSIFSYSNESAKKTYELSQCFKIQLKSVGGVVKQSLHKATNLASKLLAQLSAILFALLVHKQF